MFATWCTTASIGSLSGLASQILLSVCFQPGGFLASHLTVGISLVLWCLGTWVFLFAGFLTAQLCNTGNHHTFQKNEEVEALTERDTSDLHNRTSSEAIFGSFALVGVTVAWVFLGGRPIENLILMAASLSLIALVMIVEPVTFSMAVAGTPSQIQAVY